LAMDDVPALARVLAHGLPMLPCDGEAARDHATRTLAALLAWHRIQRATSKAGANNGAWCPLRPDAICTR